VKKSTQKANPDAMPSTTDSTGESSGESQFHRVIGVVDIGATSIRLAISQVDSQGQIENLESLSQAVSLGRDSFINGRISTSTIEECVRVLKIYRDKLREYGIENANDVHVVATSAVREARNRLSFQDRVFIATGLEVEPFDEAELHRVTFLGIQPILKTHRQLHDRTNVICEIGGGSTEMLVVNSGNVVFSETYRMGSLRLRKSLEAINAAFSEERQIINEQIKQLVQRFHRTVPNLDKPNFIAMGGDLRFAVSQMFPDTRATELTEVTINQFEAFTESIARCSPDELFNRYELSHPEAESLAPALMAYLALAKSTDRETFFVSNVNMREGLVREMIQPDAWNREFRDQVMRYSIALGRTYKFDEEFAIHVAELCQLLFEELRSEHGLSKKYGLILNISALLHEIGQFVNHRSFHKHSLYLIRNSDFFGVGQTDVLLSALVARYHRRAHPQPNHEGYSSLNRSQRVIVCKLAAILRIAIALNSSRQQKVKSLDCNIRGDSVQIRIPVVDLSLEKISLAQGSLLFKETFGKTVTVTEK
jgi:exopolyphosphatase / guanosine-5'-triphosphate,3'-diphosphate pyrophosphatase